MAFVYAKIPDGEGERLKKLIAEKAKNSFFAPSYDYFVDHENGACFWLVHGPHVRERESAFILFDGEMFYCLEAICTYDDIANDIKDYDAMWYLFRNINIAYERKGEDLFENDKKIIDPKINVLWEVVSCRPKPSDDKLQRFDSLIANAFLEYERSSSFSPRVTILAVDVKRTYLA